MKILPILAVLALGSATAAYADAPAPAAAADVPLCSRTVTDNCMNPSQAPHHARPAKSRKAHGKAMHLTHHASVAGHAGHKAAAGAKGQPTQPGPAK